MVYDSSKDRYSTPGFGGLAARAQTAVQSDTEDLTAYYDYLYVGVTGDISCIPIRNDSDTPVVFTNVAVGWFPVRVRRILETGTTATGLIGLRD